MEIRQLDHGRRLLRSHFFSHLGDSTGYRKGKDCRTNAHNPIYWNELTARQLRTGNFVEQASGLAEGRLYLVPHTDGSTLITVQPATNDGRPDRRSRKPWTAHYYEERLALLDSNTYTTEWIPAQDKAMITN